MTARPNTSKRATVSKTATKTATQRTTAPATKVPATKVPATKVPATKVPATKVNGTNKTATASSVAAAEVARPSAPVGHVSFVGSGPGDPDLLTVRAVELIRGAEVVVTEVPEHAALVRTVLGLAAPVVTVDDDGNETLEEVGGPELVDGGFGQDGQPLTHASRAKVVVKQARSGRRVVRLMAGDPFVYASGPEEAQACVKAGIAFEIVPGVSSVTAVPAYAGIPLTTKNNREVAVVTCGEARVDWSQYADERTLVLLSAVSSIAEIAKALIAAGRPATCPVSMTRVGTTTDQSTVVSTLEQIAADARAAKMAPPAITVVGDVVDLRSALSWFETKPLFGWRVLVPRTKEQAGSLSGRLRSYGAVPEEVPTISVEPPRNPQQMDKAVRGLVEGRYEWIAFTSVNAVRAVREKFDEYGLDARAFSGLKIAAVGDKTAAVIADWGLRADLVPSGEQSARGLLEDWPPYDDLLDPINRVFLPRADIATETLVAGLVELGWEVDDVTAYRTVRATPPPAPTREAIKTGRFDAVVFTSSSTVRNLVGIAGKPHAATVIAVIGPQTAKTAEEHGLRVDVMAPNPSAEVLADALADFGAARRAALVEAGQPVTKPSERRPSARRRAT
jgi:uroporphyrinogen III methyltransferase/synthase